jgi:2-dehydropantoate 2-reductase
MSTPTSSNDLPRIAVAGAGGIGLTLASHLARAGQAVSLVARGDSLTAIAKRGIRVIEPRDEWVVSLAVGAAADFGRQDILFLCSKAQDLEALAEASAPLIGPETLLVPVINGIPWWYFEGVEGRFADRSITAVDPDNALRRLLPARQVIGTSSKVAAERLAPGVVCLSTPYRMTVGEILPTDSKRPARLAALLEDAGIHTQVAPHIRDAVWGKLIMNLTSNPLSAVAGTSIADIYSHPDLVDTTRAMLQEVLPVAAAYGARLDLDSNGMFELGKSMGDARTSMLQDMEKGAPLELAAICDAVLELAELQNLSMPFTKAVTGLARYRAKVRPGQARA